MQTQSQVENRSETASRSVGADTAMGFAVLGLLGAGAIGILKAMSMESGFDVLLCLLGSVTAFGAVFYIYLGRR